MTRVDAEQVEFDGFLVRSASHMLRTEPLHTGEWQSMDTSRSPVHATYELLHKTYEMEVPRGVADLMDIVRPSYPWAENHFRERTGGEPLNPGVEYANWPWYKGNVDKHRPGGTFSHTYMERYWPKDAANNMDTNGLPMVGIRYQYGDLRDVANLLIRSPHTRQAYLPVWFPEDTGAVHGERVPCSIGYHFIIRGGRLDCTYMIRSCDLIRHFRDDVYLTARLMQWMCDQYNSREFDGSGRDLEPMLLPGDLRMHITSLHAFVGDKWKLNRMAEGKFDGDPNASTNA